VPVHGDDVELIQFRLDLPAEWTLSAQENVYSSRSVDQGGLECGIGRDCAHRRRIELRFHCRAQK